MTDSLPQSRRPAYMVRASTTEEEINTEYVTHIQDILNPREFLNHMIGSNVTPHFLDWSYFA